MGIGAEIRQRRKEMGLTQRLLATKVHISTPYLSNIETGRAGKGPSDRVLRKLERSLNFRPGELTKAAHVARTPLDVRSELELRGAQVQKLQGMVRSLMARDDQGPSDGARQAPDDEPVVVGAAGMLVPVINSVAAGYPEDFTDLDYPTSVADEYVRCPGLSDAQSFAARVVGDSMEPDYRQGDIVVFSPNTEPHNGDDCFVRFDHGCGTTFKRYYQDDEDTIRLQPLNSAYPAQTYPCEQITGLWPALFRVQRLRDP